MNYFKSVRKFFQEVGKHIKNFVVDISILLKKMFVSKRVSGIKNRSKQNKKFKVPSSINIETFLDFFSMPLRNIKIQTRLLISITGIVFILLIVTSFLSYNKSSNAIKNKISTYSIQITNQIGDILSKDIKRIENFIYEMSTNSSLTGNSLQDTLTKIIDPKTDVFYDKQVMGDYTKYLANQLGTMGSSIAMFKVILPDYTSIDYGSNIIPDEDIKKLIGDMNKSSDTNYFSFYISPNARNRKGCYPVISNKVISVTNGKHIGNIICVLRDDYLLNQYKSIDLGEDTDIFIVESNGIVVSSNNEKVETGKVFHDINFINQLKIKTSEKKYDFQAKINNKNYLITHTYLDKYNWCVVSTIPNSYLNRESNSLLWTMLYIFIICLVFTVILSFLITRSISKPLGKLVNLMKMGRDGNLAIDIEDDKKDEISVVMNNFNEMIGNIRKVVTNGDESARKVLKSAEEINAYVKRSTQLTSKIAATTMEIAEGASSQAMEISDASIYMNNLYDGIVKVQDEVVNVSEIATDTYNLSEKALFSVKSLKEKSAETGEVSNKIKNDITLLKNDAKEVKKIIKLIMDIASQTKLIALNATIEAAKAGETGKGFAVVATEVKKLANRIKEASDVVNKILNNIQQKTETTVEYANSTSHIMSEQMEAVHETDNTFKTIINGMSIVTKQIQEVTDQVKKIVSLNELTKNSLKRVAIVSEEAAATTEDVSANTQEQMNEAEELSGYASELSIMAQELNKALSIFKLD
ncbi:MAG: Methyl-accepting chemotaxis protein McpB [Firmicutes bacterium ADurb.Bin419]|nr:MAG: Methyl-accepting chemotaxis protein McpB [Firmicutes bacterium ADurb.Bin419]